MQQHLRSMTVVRICATNKICSSIKLRMHFVNHADNHDLFMGILAEVNTAGSGSLYSSDGID